jgi:hypothetical protein
VHLRREPPECPRPIDCMLKCERRTAVWQREPPDRVIRYTEDGRDGMEFLRAMDEMNVGHLERKVPSLITDNHSVKDRFRLGRRAKRHVNPRRARPRSCGYDVRVLSSSFLKNRLCGPSIRSSATGLHLQSIEPPLGLWDSRKRGRCDLKHNRIHVTETKRRC